jgi:phosphoglycolate phosphatase-like HAD superfamily hydrolase
MSARRATGGNGHEHALVLFDIDGTLIWTRGAGSRAMARAFRDWCGVEDCLAGVPVHGRTDTIILSDVLARHRLAADDEAVARLFSTYFRCLSEELAALPQGYGPLPGVVTLLEALTAQDSVTVALLTGNHSHGARIKLSRFDLERYFVLGAFGEDAADRNDLVPVALERARALRLPEVSPRGVVVVGDTPLDVACGRAHGCRTVAVATGGSGLEDLQRAGADLVVPTLEDTEALVRWIVGGPRSMLEG